MSNYPLHAMPEMRERLARVKERPPPNVARREGGGLSLLSQERRLITLLVRTLRLPRPWRQR